MIFRQIWRLISLLNLLILPLCCDLYWVFHWQFSVCWHWCYGADASPGCVNLPNSFLTAHPHLPHLISLSVSRFPVPPFSLSFPCPFSFPGIVDNQFIWISSVNLSPVWMNSKHPLHTPGNAPKIFSIYSLLLLIPTQQLWEVMWLQIRSRHYFIHFYFS